MTASVNRFGPYTLSHFGNVEPYLARWKPSVIVLHDSEAKAENVNKIRQLSPDTKIIGRLYRPDSWYSENIRANPESTAYEVAEMLQQTDWAHLVDAVITANEVCQDWSGLPSLDRFYLKLMEVSPIPQVLYSFSVENPGWSNSDPDGRHASLMKHWALVEPSMRAALSHGSILGIHQYNANRIMVGDYETLEKTMPEVGFKESMTHVAEILDSLSEEIKSDMRRIFRYEALVWPYLPEDLQQLPVICSEFGHDFLLYPYHYKAGHLDPTAAISTDDVNGQLSWFAGVWDKLYSDIPMIGWVFYAAGDSGSWEYYNMVSTQMPNGERRERPLIEVITERNPGGNWPKEPLPPPVDFDTAIKQAADAKQCISLNPAAALQQRIYRDNYNMVESEFEWEYDNIPYIVVKAEQLEHASPRVYYAPLTDYNDIKIIEY